MINNDKDFQRQVVKQLSRIADSLIDISNKLDNKNNATKIKVKCDNCAKRFVCDSDNKYSCESHAYWWYEKDVQSI